MSSKLYVNGVSPLLRREYRALRGAGFTPTEAALVIYGMSRSRAIGQALVDVFCADVYVKALKDES